MTDVDDSIFWVALTQIPGLGNGGYRRLLKRFGEPREIFAASRASLEQEVKSAVATAILAGPNQEKLSRCRSWATEAGNSIVTLANEHYPRNLLEISDPPPLLYVKGRAELLNCPAMAIVGSRSATPQGIRNAETFGRFLSEAGYCIISGLALGIDGAAHRGGLQGLSSSIAVVGTGLDIIYPARHKQLAHDLAKDGALVSEFPLGTPSMAQNFPRRNRIISGLALGCLVVEAAPQSGSLITARLAAEQGREVFAIPGSIHSPLARGCHYLIKQGAKLVESAQDVLDELGPGGFNEGAPQVQNETPRTVDEENIIRHCLGFDPVGVDVLVNRSGLTSDTVCAILLLLELKGEVSALPGGLFQQSGKFTDAGQSESI